MSDGKSVFLKEGGFSLFGTLFEKFFRYVFLAAVTFLITPDSFGKFVFVVSSITLIYGVINLNLHRAVSYYVPVFLADGETEEAAGFIRQIGIAVTALSVGVGVVVALSAPLIAEFVGRPDTAFLFLVLSPLIPLYATRDMLRESFRSLERIRYVVLTQSILFPALQLVITVGALSMVSALLALSFGIAFSWVLVAITGGYLLMRMGLPFGRSEGHAVSWRELFGYSLPLLGFGIIGSLLTQVDIILLGVLADSDAPAFFRIAFSVAALSKMFPQMFKSISKPLFAKTSSDSVDVGLSDFYLTTARWGALLTVPAVVFLLVEHSLLVSVLFDRRYAAAALAVPILVIGNGFATFWGYHGTLLEATNNTRVIFARGVIALGVNVIVDILLIPQFGIVGAAVGTTAALLASTLVELGVAIRREIGQIPFTRYHLSYLVVGATSGILIWVTPTVISPLGGLVLDAVIIAVGYPLGCVFLKGLTDEDAEIVEMTASKIERSTGFRPEVLVRLARYGAGVPRK